MKLTEEDVDTLNRIKLADYLYAANPDRPFSDLFKLAMGMPPREPWEEDILRRYGCSWAVKPKLRLVK